MREKGKGIKGEEGAKDSPLDREETDVAHRQMVVYKGKGETLC